MMGRPVVKGSLNYGFQLDDHVPGNHILCRIDGPFDFGLVREALTVREAATRLKVGKTALYKALEGAPAKAPA